MSDELTLQLTLTITYKTNGVEKYVLHHELEQMVERAINNGLLTGETDAEVKTWNSYIGVKS